MSINIKALETIKESLRKKYPESLILNGGDIIPPLQTVLTRDPCLDSLLGGGLDLAGIPRGRMVEISGTNSSGKTTLSLEILAMFHEEFPERAVLFIDNEAALDKVYAQHMGVPFGTDRVIYVRPDSGKDALDILLTYVQSGLISAVALDSWASLIPPGADDNADEGKIGEAPIGDMARFSSNSLRSIKPELAKHDCTFLILNQERVNMTAMGARGKNTPGGNAMTFYPDLRLQIRKPDKEGDERIVQVIKSKTQALCWTECSVYIKHNLGLDRVESIISAAIIKNKIKVGGAGWHTMEFSAGKEKIQGREKLAALLTSNQELLDSLCDSMGMRHIVARLPLVRQPIVAET